MFQKLKSNGFTLIELLVVIAIIAILAGILFPVFARAKKSAYTANDISNLRQIGTSIQLYCADNNDLLPYASNASTRNILLAGANHQLKTEILSAKSPPVLLKPYGATTQLWESHLDCLSVSDNTGTTWNCSSSYFKKYQSSYFYDENSALQGKSLSSYADSSKCALAADQEAFRSQGDANAELKMAVLYADGHSKLVPRVTATNDFCNWLGIYP